jgi:hypothetical protein
MYKDMIFFSLKKLHEFTLKLNDYKISKFRL